MKQYLSDVTAVSSKGQVVLPKAIREGLQLKSGDKLMVLSDGVSIVLTPIPKPDISEFKNLMDATFPSVLPIPSVCPSFADAPVHS